MKKLAERLFGGPRAQSFWERIHKLFLHSMNYGRDGFVDESGERWCWTTWRSEYYEISKTTNYLAVSRHM